GHRHPPFRQDPGEHRKSEQPGEGEAPDEVPGSGRGTAQRQGRRRGSEAEGEPFEGGVEKRREPQVEHHFSPFLASSIKVERRSSSSSVISPADMSRRAVTAFSVEPSKNVRTSRVSSDSRASSPGTVAR